MSHPSTEILPETLALLMPSGDFSAKKKIADSDQCWLGRIFTWICTNIFGGIGHLFAMILCCAPEEELYVSDPDKFRQLKPQENGLTIDGSKIILANSISGMHQTLDIPPPVKPMPVPKGEIGAIPVIDANDLDSQKSLNEFLTLIATSTEYDEWIGGVRKDLKPNARRLQFQLGYIVNKLRSPDGDQSATPLDLVLLQKLLKACGCNLSKSTGEVIVSLGYQLGVSSAELNRGLIPIKWREVMPLLLPAPQELTPADEKVIGRALTNLGCTCYMNSVLQMIARLNCFNELLTKPIEFIPTFKNPEESDEVYQARLQRDQDEFDSRLDYRNALQAQLCAVIQMMRTPTNHQAIGSEELEVLFRLLQICGWDRSPGQQEDPHELIAFLRMQLGANVSPIRQVEKYSYVKIGELKSIEKSSCIDEISVSLPIDEDGTLPAQFDTMDKLIGNYAHEHIPASEGYRPEEDGPSYDVDKDIYFVGKAPDTLFIQQKRFGFDMTALKATRIDAETPFSETIQVPFYNADNLSRQPVIHTYRLKVVIGHSGGTSPNSGHYTTMALQQYQSQDAWIRYDDSRRQRYHSDLKNPKSVVVDVQKKAYYLAYERVVDNTEVGCGQS